MNRSYCWKYRIANFLINRLLIWAVGSDWRSLKALELILEDVRLLRLSAEGMSE